MSIQESVDRLASEVRGNRQSIDDFKTESTIAIHALEDEIAIQKRLAKYARRTWFEVMAYIFLAGLLLSDLVRAYGHSDWWSLIVWTSQHGSGGPVEWLARCVGFLLQAAFLIWLGRRSQVPPDLFERTPHGSQVASKDDKP